MSGILHLGIGGVDRFYCQCESANDVVKRHTGSCLLGLRREIGNVYKSDGDVVSVVVEQGI